MNYWIPALSTSALLAFALWMTRSLITNRLSSSVKHEFDEKLEALRSGLRQSEDKLKAEVRARESEIELLRSGALSGLTSRQTILDKRKIEAIDQLWKAFVELMPARSLALTMAVIKFESAAKISAQNPKARQLFSVMAGDLDKNKVFTTHAELARPYLPDIVWAIYSAYYSILVAAFARMEILKSGLDMADAVDVEVIKKLLVAALPHHSGMIKELKSDSLHIFLDLLEMRLLAELRQAMQGTDSDAASIAQAAEILKQSNAVMTNVTTKTIQKDQ